ncbi:MAG: uroporphyrinogen-III synthase [Beijerinckiaceae bacterium]
MRVLLTRARADAERSAATLAALGHTSVVSPVIHVVATGATLPAGRFDAIIATSAHAFSGIDAQTLALFRLYAVGERTNEAARAAGLTAPPTVANDARGLAEAIVERLRPSARLLYLAGRERKPDLETLLAQSGLCVTTVETYIAEPARALTDAAAHELAAGRIDIVLHYSRRSADLFVGLAKAAQVWRSASRPRHLALSADVAAPLLASGANVEIAAAPDEAHLLALLRGSRAR